MTEDEYEAWKIEQKTKQKEYRRKIYLEEKEKKREWNLEERKRKKDEKIKIKKEAILKKDAALWESLRKGSDLKNS